MTSSPQSSQPRCEAWAATRLTPRRSLTGCAFLFAHRLLELHPVRTAYPHRLTRVSYYTQAARDVPSRAAPFGNGALGHADLFRKLRDRKLAIHLVLLFLQFICGRQRRKVLRVCHALAIPRADETVKPDSKEKRRRSICGTRTGKSLMTADGRKRRICCNQAL